MCCWSFRGRPIKLEPFFLFFYKLIGWNKLAFLGKIVFPTVFILWSVKHLVGNSILYSGHFQKRWVITHTYIMVDQPLHSKGLHLLYVYNAMIFWEIIYAGVLFSFLFAYFQKIRFIFDSFLGSHWTKFHRMLLQNGFQQIVYN